jgi:hypothetical protein
MEAVVPIKIMNIFTYRRTESENNYFAKCAADFLRYVKFDV